MVVGFTGARARTEALPAGRPRRVHLSALPCALRGRPVGRPRHQALGRKLCRAIQKIYNRTGSRRKGAAISAKRRKPTFDGIMGLSQFDPNGLCPAREAIPRLLRATALNRPTLGTTRPVFRVDSGFHMTFLGTLTFINPGGSPIAVIGWEDVQNAWGL